MAELLKIRKVESRADLKAMIEFPWTLYKDDPYWVPPLLSMQWDRYERDKASAWKHMTGEFFIAWRGDQPVGTIAAFVNHRHNEFQGENIGFFGALELYDDQLIADALFEHAEKYVREQGADALRGPATFSSNDQYGLLVEGFDDPPVLMDPYNPRYYVRLIENLPGYEKAMDLYSWHLTLQGTEESHRAERLKRITERNNERRGITVRFLKRRTMKADFRALKDVYNSAWEKNWGFVPFSDQELDELVADLGMYVEPDLTVFAEVKGEPAGFLLGIPDIYQALHPVRARPGKPEIISMVQTFWNWRIRPKINRIRIPLMGVKEQFRGIGVEGAMFAALYERAVTVAPKRGWDYADGGWVLETNDAMNKLCEAHNGRVYKRYRLYQKAL